MICLAHVPRRGGGELHHQHRADREVRGDEDVRFGFRQIGQLSGVKAGRPDHHVYPGGDRFARVGHGGRRHGEVDEHVGALAQRLSERRVERRIDTSHELHVVGACDGVAHRLTHPSRGTGDGDADRAHAL